MEQIFITILLYSLGLGLILALMTGLTLILTRTSSPLLRYRILVFLLASFALGTVTIGFRAIESATEASQTVSRGTEKTFHIQQDNNSPAQVSIFKQGYHLLNSNSRIIALIWLLIVVIKSIKLGSNLLELHYLKTRKIFPAGEYWETRLEQLSKKIGLNKTVKIMQSGIIQVPVVIGHFKPVILIPLGMITAIKPQEIEMMLLHELAHIKRMDFLANMMQHILELLFFFNPAVLWTSALIRKERENCCDEMVLQSAASKQSYIQALLSFKEYQLRVPAYAMAFAKESNLIVRVKRMVYQKNTALNSLEKGCLLVAVLLLCSFSVLRATSISQNTVKFQEPVPKKNKEQNKTSTVGKITGPKSGTQVTKSRKSTSEVPVHIQKDDSWKEQREIEASANGSSHETVNTNQNGNKNGTTNISINIDNKKIENFAVNIANTVTNAINLALDSSLKYTSNIDLSSDPHPAVNVKLNTQTKLNTRTKVNPQARLNVQATPISNVKLSPTPKVEVNTSGLTEILIGAMEKAGINTKGENLEFHVTNTQLIVNGKKQSEKILNAVLTDVIKSSKDTIDFTYTRTGNVISTSSIYNRN